MILFILVLLSLVPLLVDQSDDDTPSTSALVHQEDFDKAGHTAEQVFEDSTVSVEPSEETTIQLALTDSEDVDIPPEVDSQVEVVVHSSDSSAEVQQLDEPLAEQKTTTETRSISFSTTTLIHLALAGCSSLFVILPAMVVYKRKRAKTQSKSKRIVRSPVQQRKKEIWSTNSPSRKAVEQYGELLFADDVRPSSATPSEESVYDFDLFLTGSSFSSLVLE